MKKIILLVFILFNILSLDLYSTGCQLSSDCVNTQFAYRLCNSDSYYYKCSSNCGKLF